jgi:hypothetical protein
MIHSIFDRIHLYIEILDPSEGGTAPPSSLD